MLKNGNLEKKLNNVKVLIKNFPSTDLKYHVCIYTLVGSGKYLNCNNFYFTFCVLAMALSRYGTLILKESHIEIIAHTIPNILTVCLINCNSDVQWEPSISLLCVGESSASSQGIHDLLQLISISRQTAHGERCIFSTAKYKVFHI